MFENHTIEASGLSFRYQQAGQGKDLLLVHGLGASLEYWERVMPELAKHYRVTALDVPGFGLSSKPDVHYELPFFTKALTTFCEAMNFKSFYLAGHSLGGALSLDLAATYPEKVEKLCLIDNAGFSRQVTWAFRVMSFPFIAKHLIYKTKLAYEKVLKLSVYNKEAITPDFVDRLYEMAKSPEHRRTVLYILANHANLRGMKMATLKPLWEKFHALEQTPVKIIWGDRDPLLNVSQIKAAKKHLKQADVSIIHDCGHIPMLEKPRECLKLMLEFLKFG